MKINKNLYLIIILLFTLTISCSSEKAIINISPNQLTQLMTDSNFVLIDVRQPEELVGNLGKIEGAINIPLPELESRLAEIEKFRSNKIGVICRSGNRSKKAAYLLINNGFNTLNVEGGMKAYNLLKK